MTTLGAILDWKFKTPTNVTTRGNVITYWDPANGPEPSPTELATYRAEYEQYLVDMQYRKERQLAYIRDLSTEGHFVTSVGDILDAIIKKLRGDDTEFNELIVKIDKIKSDHPKPSQ